ncbi:MAG: 2-C-methyl-D-erythritol 4-phosphate cytidylyltransferase [Oscillospiraceae bacterium]|nr:2-C-methyl-D-erythritol 4-phosphate cytidylyltransferase [Oscillospiraceae bacterium]
MDYKKILDRFRTNTETPHCSAVILAAGSSTRMGQDKSILSLGGIPVIIRAIRAFEQHELVDEIIVVTREEAIQSIADLCVQFGMKKVKKVMAGGTTRAESSLAGVVATDSKAKYIAIHDGARPLVTQRVITDTLYGARDYHAAIPVIPSTDTLRCVENGFIGGDVDRDSVIRVQTPQIFDADLIKGALTYAAKKQIPVTDDSSAVRLTGFKIKTVDGDVNNIKLTTPDDLPVAEAILREREGETH